MSADLWQRGCERLAAELPEQQFNTWIRPLPAADVTEQSGTPTVVTLRVPNRFKLDWIRNQYGSRIETVLTEIAGKPVRLDITLAATTHTRPAVPAVNGHGLAHVAGQLPRGAAPATPVPRGLVSGVTSISPCAAACCCAPALIAKVSSVQVNPAR